MLLNLHLLRAAAALAVVYFHVTSEAGLNFRVNVGAHGVDVFFVVSGFIIAYVGARAPDRFLLRRITRIVPAYWTATLAVFALAAFAPGLLHSTRADVVQLLCSLLFIPRETTYGGVVPTLVLGWSLNYEMYFYGLFALSLLAAPRSAAPVCCAAIIAIALTIQASGMSHASLRFYARPLVLEFVYGVGAYLVFEALERRAMWFTRRPAVRRALWLASIGAALGLVVEETHGGFGVPRCVAAGVPAFALVLSSTLLERVYGVRVRSKVVHLIGESSYVLYLIHPYVIYGLLRTALPRGAVPAAPAAFALAVALVALSALTAVAVHVWLEAPALRALRRRFLRPVVPPEARMASAVAVIS
jgi:peptidoglycan/LPS O-acetylase OafA/YrhL